MCRVDRRRLRRYTGDARLRNEQTSDPWSSESDDERALFDHPDRHYHYHHRAARPGAAEELIVSPVIQRSFRGRPGWGGLLRFWSPPRAASLLKRRYFNAEAQWWCGAFRVWRCWQSTGQ